MIESQRLPTLWRNVRSTRTWRPRDMVNWHRMVRSLRGLPVNEPVFDFFQLVVEMCSAFQVDYVPEAARPAPPALPPAMGACGVALFVDAPDHVSGVATTLGQWAAQAARRARDLTIYHAGHRDLFARGIRFAPMGALHLGAYEGLRLLMPVVADVLRTFERMRPAAVHLSTPGPMGLLGLLCARQFDLPVFATYHTDFPAYAARLSGESRIEAAAWKYMRWFYGQVTRVAAPSPSTRRLLVANGIDDARIQVVGRGIDVARFSPDLRDQALRARWGGMRRHWLLYVGRLSREKNLEALATAFSVLAARGTDVGLVVTGDGPYRGELERRLAGLPVVFTGEVRGAELARIYASADLFVFPSETDTLGVVLLEAQASGVPVLVSGEGGPKDCMRPERTGWVVQPMEAGALAAAIERALQDPRRLAAMSSEARAYAAGHTWDASFAGFWRLHFPEARVQEVRQHA